MKTVLLTWAMAVLSAFNLAGAQSADLALLEQQALQAASQRVADSVVQIRTVGGLDRVGRTTLALGPTTGVIISSDGYLVSSTYNFAQQPSSILVRLPDGSQVPAELVARDKTRMLVLLKVDSERPLPVPEAAPLDQVEVGQWAVAVGRTFRADQVGVSVGIVSARQRMFGRVVQTDANVSVANYGGPLVDVHGRVIGILTPMSPQSTGAQSETAGAEYYDSGIGFAVPWEHILEVLPRWRSGDDLLPGKLGVGLRQGSPHTEPPRLTTVWRGSPAAQADWRADDLIVAVEEVPVKTQAQLRFALLPRYAGETLAITIRRGEAPDAEEFTKNVTLAGELQPFRHAFLGVLPVRDTPDGEDAGVGVRAVWPGSPAEQAGLLPGDRITRIDDAEVSDVPKAMTALAGIAPEESARIAVERENEQLQLSATLALLPNEILIAEALPEVASEGDAASVELEPLRVAEFAQEASYLAPDQSVERPHGVLLWLASDSPAEDQSLAESWLNVCRRDDLLLVIAHPKAELEWSSEDLPFAKILLRMIAGRFESDPRRTVVAGRGKAGQLAYALALDRRSRLAGVVTVDAPLPRTLRLPPTLPGRRLTVLAIESPNTSFAPLIRKNVEQLLEAGYSTAWWQRPFTDDTDSELDATTRDTIARWLDGLDRF